MEPSPFDLFAFYHLGIDPQGRYRFANLHDVARTFGLSAAQVQALLERYGLDAETVSHVDYNLAEAHADAQQIAWANDPAALLAHARACFEMFREALVRADPSRRFFHVDYDDIWGDGKRSP